MTTEIKTDARWKQLMALRRYTQSDLDEIATIGRLRPPYPDPSGTDGAGNPFWTKDSLMRWAAGAVRIRSASTGELQYRKATLHRMAPTRSKRGQTWNPDDRSFEAIAATEQPIDRYDFETGETYLEVLLSEGGEFPERMPLLDGHRRDSLDAVIGSATNPRLVGREWIVDCQLANTESADKAFGLIDDRHADSVSVGYIVEETVAIPPGGSRVIDGREFHNPSSEMTLVVATRWRCLELSLVPVGADSNCKIRSDNEPNYTRTNMYPTSYSKTAPSRPSMDALVSSMLHRSGVNDPSRCLYMQDRSGRYVKAAPSSQTVRAAEQGEVLMRSGSPALAIRAALEMDGADVYGYNSYSIIRSAWRATQLWHLQGRSASTTNLATLFQNTFASLLLSAHDARGDSTEGWVGESENLTFQPQPRNRLTAAELSLHAKGGVAEELEVETVAEMGQVARYSAKITETEEDLINANSVGVGIIEASLPKQIGDAAASLRPDLVYSTLLSNPVIHDGNPLFHAAHGNAKTSAALADGTLAAAQQAISVQRENGVALNMRATHLIVPPTLERPAGKLLKDVYTGDANSTPVPILRVDSRLENGLVHPLTEEQLVGSASTWFMASDSEGHNLEIQYLAGRDRLPRISMWFLDRGDFGVCFAVDHVLGVVPIGWRGLVRNLA